MTLERDPATQETLDGLLRANGLSGDTKLYRETLRQSLTSTNVPGVYRIAANSEPGETVVDVYGQGHLAQAEQVGPGLAFAESSNPNWQETMEMRVLDAQRNEPGAPPLERVEVEARLEDVLRQGGLIYPVESVTVERAWYCTLPAGFLEVAEVS